MADLKLLEEVTRALAAAGDPERAAAVARAVPGARTNGAPVPVLRVLAADFRRRHKLDFATACALCDRLCASGARESLLFAAFLAAAYRRDCAALPWSRLEGWLARMDNWETCDQFAMCVAAERVAADPRRGLQRLRKLAGSPDIWRRRFALAIAAALNQKGRFVPALTLEICQMLLADPEPMIQTSLGWALRELSKKDPEMAYAFLADQRSQFKPRTLREASAKLPPALKRRLLD